MILMFTISKQQSSNCYFCMEFIRLADVVHSNPTEKSFQLCHNSYAVLFISRTAARVAVEGYVNLPVLRLIEISAIGLFDSALIEISAISFGRV